MASVPGFRFDISGASGSQGLLAPREGWKAYILPRGGYAAQASTGALVTFDSSDIASRFAVNDWVQVGLSTANIKQVGAVGGNSISLSGALTVSKNDRVFIFGQTEPTLTGGSATYTSPNTTIYQRDDTTADTYTNSMITTNANGLVQGYAATGVYDCLIQDSNRTNQGYIADLMVGVAEGISVSDTAYFGSTILVSRQIAFPTGTEPGTLGLSWANGTTTQGPRLVSRGALWVLPEDGNTDAFFCRAAGSSRSSIEIEGSTWGPGTARVMGVVVWDPPPPVGTLVEEISAAGKHIFHKTDGAIDIIPTDGTSATITGMFRLLDNGGNLLWLLRKDGRLEWAAGTTGCITDTTLYRGTTYTLKTDGRFVNSNILTTTNGDTSPTVWANNVLLTANTVTTSIVDFDDGLNGQVIHVIIGDTWTGVSNGGNLIMASDLAIPSQNKTISFVSNGTVWYELGRRG